MTLNRLLPCKLWSCPYVLRLPYRHSDASCPYSLFRRELSKERRPHLIAQLLCAFLTIPGSAVIVRPLPRLTSSWVVGHVIYHGPSDHVYVQLTHRNQAKRLEDTILEALR